MKITLETSRLILRPFMLSDAEEMFFGWTSDDDVTKYLTWNSHKDINETKKILSLWVSQYEKPERLNFAITLKENNKLIGGIDVVGYLDGVPVIGYTLAKEYWNKGYVTEACKSVVDILFLMGHEKIIIDAVVENIASNKVIIKCGGTLVSTYTETFENKNITFNINRYYIKKAR